MTTGSPSAAHEDIGRLEVAVDDAMVMRVLHRLTDPGHQGQPRPAIEVLLSSPTW